jgi:hypothetical protein
MNENVGKRPGRLPARRLQEDSMSRVQRRLIPQGMAFALPALTVLLLFPGASAADVSALNGTWRSAPDEMRLSTPFDESVWGKDARSIRTVEMVIRQGGNATLSVTRRVVDAKRRAVPGSTSIEHATLVLSEDQASTGPRTELAVTVKQAERRYPDDPQGTWMIDGLRVGVVTFKDKPGEVEVRVDFPEGRGSFWETLRRVGGAKK